jgi:hypothetical protein
MESRGPAARKGAGYDQLITAISAINTQMVGRVATVANQALVLRNWMVGAYIVEFEQHGADRAKYGARLLETLAGDLKARDIKGLGAEMLRNCRLFYLRYPQISQPVVGKFESPPALATIPQPPVGKLKSGLIRSSPVTELASLSNSATTGCGIRQTVSVELPTPLEPDQLVRISWAHFLELIRLEDPRIALRRKHDQTAATPHHSLAREEAPLRPDSPGA